ncbi:MAG: sigma 54-interacting transcriptional regulator [Desulfuromonadales bacterium]|nr:sigma 54-interacting transcriptional regulator [Desulfuromonadales bacterium]
MTSHILIIDDEESLRFTLQSFLQDENYVVSTAASFTDAEELVKQSLFDLVFLDIQLGRHSGLDLLKVIREKFANCPVVMITGAPDVTTAAEAVRQGAFDYIPKPIRQDTLLRVAKMALKHKTVVDQREQYRAHLSAMFDSVRDGLLLVDERQNILQANHALINLFGLPERVLGMSLSQLPQNIRSTFIEIVEKIFVTNKPVTSQRLEITSPSQRECILNISAAPCVAEMGNPFGVVLTVRDETRLESLERSLKKRQKFEHIVGRSEAVQTMFGLIENLAEVDTTVLITGESGTGKELVAEALHYRSDRRNAPLVKINCAALPENLLESELFGHLKGSFTGALKDKVGRFEQADGGTVFLDEIGDISPAMQVRLLRVLQNKEIEKVGGTETIKVDVRIVAATNQDLLKKVREDEFREDLYYRLRVVQIPMPPLRNRRDDIPLLVDHFVAIYNERFKRQVQGVTAAAMKQMTRYDWPGNIRELQHSIEHGFVLCRDDLIDLQHLPPELKESTISVHDQQKEQADETTRIVEALDKAGWNKSRAARILGVSRRTIYRKMDELGIDDEEESP